MASPADPRGISVTTPLGPDALFLTAFRGREGISQLFHFQLELMAENRQNIAFDKLIGQKITFSILLPDGKTKRFFNGICNSLAQSGRDATFTQYRMEVVPQLWLLTRRTQCRIFQHLSIPDILKKVLTGLDIKLELQGAFEPRDYCVQYRESDFAFASRLMEEEGIYYFFKHTDGGHQMVLGNSPATHPAVAFAEKAIYEELEGGNRPDMRVGRWEKSQELRSGKVTLWDHCFELPGQHLDAERPTQESVVIGKVTHKLKLPANDPLELYDYPGAYAQRVDGVDRGGGDQAGNLAKIFQDNKRTAAIRMEQEAVQAITLRGSGNCRQFMAGHKFTLERHPDADGPYVLTSIEHNASASAGGRSGASDGAVNYQNHFTCIPLALPYRAPFTTPEPIISGPQTAVVVGPPGEIIFCDKYGRIKVQFPWDRQGKKDADSSCWIRVSNNWGGANWGGMFVPHVGQEVIVEFEEGDPDRPLVTGRVYNAECMPPLKLPDNKTQSIIRDHGGNQIKLQGDNGVQQITMYSPHADTHFTIGDARNPPPGISGTTSAHMTLHIGQNSTAKIGGNLLETIDKDKVLEVLGNMKDHVFGSWDHKTEGSLKMTILGMKNELIIGSDTKVVGGVRNDLTYGLRLNVMKGNRYESNPNGALKSEKDLKKVGSVLQSLGKVYVKIGGNRVVKLVEDEVKATEHKRAGGKIHDNVEEVDIDASGRYHLSAPDIILEGNVIIKGNLKVLEDCHVCGAFTTDKDNNLD